MFENIKNTIDFFIRNKTKFSMLKEYGDLVGVDIEKQGYFFTYKLLKENKYDEIRIRGMLKLRASPLFCYGIRRRNTHLFQ